MNNRVNKKASQGMVLTIATTLLCTAAFISAGGVARSDDTYDLAPPVTSPAAPDTTAPAATPTQATVFNWHEVPENQEVPINRAVFDQGGYQLYDTVGETIIIPFKDNNLYVMKFALSKDDSTYFVNTGDAPVLYLPQDGYLENGTVAGAKWYPFTGKFAPTDPVYLGVAPDWSDYVGVGWYPDMCCYGGYYCDSPYGVFEPCLGLSICFGGHSFFGWGAYCDYCVGYPAPFFIGFFDSGIYGWGSTRYWGGRDFRGGYWPGHSQRGYGGHGITSGYGGGGNRGGSGGHSFASGGYRVQDHSFNSSDFRSGGSSSRSSSFRGAGVSSGSHSFDRSFGGGSRSFGGSFSGGSHSFDRSSGGGSRSFGGSFGGGSHSFGGSGGGSRSFGGSFGGGSHSFGGSGGGSHSFGGGGGGGGGFHGGGGGGGRR